MTTILYINRPVHGVEGVPSNVSDEAYLMLIGAMAIAQKQTMARLDFVSRLKHRDYTETIDINLCQLEVECHEPKPLVGQPDTTDFVRNVGSWEATILKKTHVHTSGSWVRRSEHFYRTCVMNVTGDLDQFEKDVMVMKLSGLFECPD